MTGLLVVVPTYNEADNVELIVTAIRAATPAADVLVVDDRSPDGTGFLAEAMATGDPQLHVLHRNGPRGLGAAYRAGFGWGLDRGYTEFVQMDADGSHRPEEIDRLLAALRPDVGLVLGSRWVPHGKVVNWPLHRLLLSRAGNAYAGLALRTRVRDATGGFRAYRRDTLLEIDLDQVQSQGYCFQVDMLRRTLATGHAVVEVPICFVERERGVSKMSSGIVAEALWRVTVWGVRRRLTPSTTNKSVRSRLTQPTH